MSEFRRGLMMTSSIFDEYGYIKAGKVAHFDGIDKGETANAWTDLITGNILTLTGSATELTNGWSMPGGTGNYFRGNGYTWGSSTTQRYTSEVCIVYNSGATQAMVFATDSGTYFRPMFFFNASDENPHLRGVNAYQTIGSTWSFTPANDNVYTISASQSLAICNGTSLTLNGSGGGRWNMDSQAGYFKISGRRRGSTNTLPFKGTIYSIRVYDRELTSDEVLNNQRVDNTRFNLGLTI